MRRILPFVLAVLLGAGSALVAACGAGSDAGIPAADATTLMSQITDVREAVEDGRCSDVPGQLRQVDLGIDDLPPSVDDQLVNSLRDGADKLLGLAREECGATTTATTPTETTTTQTTTTETVPVETTTQPTETTTTATTTTPTPTAPTPTTTQPAPPPPTTTPAPAPPPVPPPPPGTPGGGVAPVIPP